jgi:type VI secretion system secreted protein Hcp
MILGKFGDIKGEVGIDQFTDQIELHSFQWGVGVGVSTPSQSTNNERSASMPSFSEATVTKAFDLSSCQFMQKCVTGDEMKVELTFLKSAGGENKAYMTVVMENVLISGFSLSSGGDMPSESISLNYTKFQVTYISQSANSDLAGKDKFGWDLVLNKAAAATS